MLNRTFSSSPASHSGGHLRLYRPIFLWLPWLTYLAVGIAAGALFPLVSPPQLAENYVMFYWQESNFVNFLPIYFSLLSAAWLQLTILALLGLNVLGTVLLPGYYLLKGFAGAICAKTALLAGGAKGLVVFWLLSWLPELGLLLVTVPFCRQLAGTAAQLFRLVFYRENAMITESTTGIITAKKYLLSLLSSAALSVAAACITMFFAILLLK